MSRPNNQPELPRAAIFRPPEPQATPAAAASHNQAPLIPSSSPAFATPAHPIRPFAAPAPAALPHSKPSVLPILLPPATLRPLAFRTFTKKHSLTLTSGALQVLATFVGRHCGSGWREQGLAEHVLEEVARSWKRGGGGVIVDGEGGDLLAGILKTLEGSMSGGRIVVVSGRGGAGGLSRQNSLLMGDSQDKLGSAGLGLGQRPHLLGREDSQSSLGMSGLDVDDDGEEEGDENEDPRKWLRVIDAYEQPRLVYNVGKKHFERDTSKPSLLPPPSHKTQVFRNRYNLIHQRLLRNESFQTRSFETGQIPSFGRSASSLATTQSYKLTPIANLLGRNGSNHLLLGLLTIAPTGILAINDLTGSIALDLTQARTVPEDGAWFVPGMIVLVDGVYEEEDDVSGGGLGGGGGVGGAIGGKFVGFTVGGPPCERRQVTLGVSGSNEKGDITAGGGFGWVDFLGVGSVRAVGSRMQKIEQRLIGRPSRRNDYAGRGRIVIMGEVNLDQPRTLQALKKVFGLYAAEPEEDTPMTFILMGNFVQHAIMARGGSGGSIEYKEYFDALASTLSEFPTLLQSATFIFVPGDNDGWASSFSSGAATPIPRKAIPDMFTSRIKRAFANANAEADRGDRDTRVDGEAIWTTNPSRLSLFGPAHEIVLFRDDMSSRFRRTAIRFPPAPKPSTDPEDEPMEMSTPNTTTPAPQTAPHLHHHDAGDDDDDAMQIDSAVLHAESHLPSTLSQPLSSTTTTTTTPPSHKLTQTLLDQGHLSPFPLSVRPVLWDYASAAGGGPLALYPLPTALVLADADAPAFCVTYEGCHVMNPGRVLAPGRRGVVRWVEYDVWRRGGGVREVGF